MFTAGADTANPKLCSGLVSCSAITLVFLLASGNLANARGAGNSGASTAGANLRSASTSTTFFVATNGNDSWSGTLAAPNSRNTNGPFASLAKAQLAVEALRQSSPTTVITVMVRQGTYYLPLSLTNPGTLDFTTVDSGTASAPVI